MTKRCKHNNCTVKEETVTYLEWVVHDGEPMDDGYAGNASPTGLLQVECDDCGKIMVFRRYHPD